MDSSRFDRVTRSFAVAQPRRAVWHGLAVSLGLFSSQHNQARAKKGKRKKPKKNAFGCLNVGQKCRGNSANCCSGLCVGKKPKRDKKDKSRCFGHDANGCLTGQTLENCGGAGTGTMPCATSAGKAGRCLTTTGNAAYCGANGAMECVACKKDVDCQAMCGPQAACSPCLGCGVGTACVGPENISTCRVPV